MRYNIRLRKLCSSSLPEYLEPCTFELFFSNVGIQDSCFGSLSIGDRDREGHFFNRESRYSRPDLLERCINRDRLHRSHS